MSLRDDNMALEKKNNVLNEIVNLVTAAGLATSNAALYAQAKPEYQSSSAQLDDTEEEKKKKKKKKKKGKGEDADTVILLPEQPTEEKDNFVMPNSMRHLETANRFATLHGKGEGTVLPERASKKTSPVGIRNDVNNNGKSNDMHGLINNSTVSSASGDNRASPSEIFYSDAEDEAGNPGELAIPGWRQEFSLRDGRDFDRHLEGVFMFSNIIQPPVLHHGSVLVALMNVPPDSELKDYVNLLPGTIDVKIGKSLYYLPELTGPKTRAIAAFNSVEEADRVASFKQIYWSDVIVPLKKVCKIKGIVPGKGFVREMTENLAPNAEATGSKVWKSCDFLKYPLNCLVEMEEVPVDYKLQDLKNILPEIIDVKMGQSLTHPKKHPHPKTRALAAFSSAKDAAHAVALTLVLTKSNDVILLKKVDTGPNSLLPNASDKNVTAKNTTASLTSSKNPPSSYAVPGATAKKSLESNPISKTSTLSNSSLSPTPRLAKTMTAAMGSKTAVPTTQIAATTKKTAPTTTTKSATTAMKTATATTAKKTVTAASKTAATAAEKSATATRTTKTAATKKTTTTSGNTPQSGSPVDSRPSASTSGSATGSANGSATGSAPWSLANPVPSRFPHPPPMRPQMLPNQYQPRSGFGGYGYGGYGYGGYGHGGYGNGYDYGYGGYGGYGPRPGY